MLTTLDIYVYTSLLRKEKESLIPNDCHCGETHCTGYDPNILVSPENKMLLMLIVISSREMNAERNIVTGLYINTRY